MSALTLTVSEFNAIMTDIIHHQLSLNQLCIHGEIRQFNLTSNKAHLYLTLAHESATLQCVIYNQHLKTIPVLTIGIQCSIIGQCRYLKNKGQLIFSGHAITLGKPGMHRDAIEKKRLAMEACGQLTRKTPELLPKQLHHIGIITALDSAAFYDIKRTLSNHPHTFKTSVIGATMQGILSAQSITDAIETLIGIGVDLIGIARGGGSESDFDSYNDDALCHTIAHCDTPIVTGIGHDINTTLACLNANQSFATPTALASTLCHHSMNQFYACINQLQHLHQKNKTDLTHQIHDVQSIAVQLKTTTHQAMQALYKQMDQLTQQCILLNPIETLRKGYTYCQSTKGTHIQSVEDIQKNDMITIQFWNGSANGIIHYVNTKKNDSVTSNHGHHVKKRHKH